MSRIYFEAPHREVEVCGSERAWLRALTQRIAWGLMEPYVGETVTDCNLVEHAVGFRSEEIDRETDPFRKRMLTKERFRTWFSVGGIFTEGEAGIKVGDNIVPTWEFGANTAMAVGNDVIKLAAKIHGTCEDFAWIAAEDCLWFSGIVREGRDSGVFRPNAGWEDVLALAHEVIETGNGPIVMHYSVSDSFPSEYAAEGAWEPQVCGDCGVTLEDAWYDLSSEEQWNLSVQGIQKRRFNRQISPEMLPVGFMYGETLFDLVGEAVHEAPPLA